MSRGAGPREKLQGGKIPAAGDEEKASSGGREMHEGTLWGRDGEEGIAQKGGPATERVGKKSKLVLRCCGGGTIKGVN